MTPPPQPVASVAILRPPPGLGRRGWAILTSPTLAIALLVGVLASCLAGVTVVRGARAWELIFSTLWFNALLVLLALSSGLTFLARTWGRRRTLVSIGMLLFHVSFMSLLGGVVFNSLFHFKGVLRLTEGETLPNGDPASYDSVEAGRLFDFARLRGETTLRRMHPDFKVDGRSKRAAYEITVGEGTDRVTGTIYMTQNLDRDGVRYLVSKEGYSIGVVLLDRQGRERYAGMVPLQSQEQDKGVYLYTTGSADAPGSFPFPPPPDPAAFLLQVVYVPDQQRERAGQVEFTTWRADEADTGARGVTGQVPLGGRFDTGDRLLEAREVRYWVGMTVRHDPGLTPILASLWAGLAGMTMSFVGRIRQDWRRGVRT